MARPDKATAVAELAEGFRSSSAVLLTEYRGLTVAQLKELRRSLGGEVTYAVVKNTLTKIAARDAAVSGLDDLLVGPSALAFVKGDPVEAAKGLRDFARTNPALVIKGGVMDGRPLTAAEIRTLADLESREVLLAKLAGAMKASLSGAVSLFAAPLAQTARLLEALRQQVEATGPASAPVAESTSEAPEAPAADEATEASTENAEVSTENAEASTENAEVEASTDAEAGTESSELPTAVDPEPGADPESSPTPSDEA